jgi:polyhydroxyalkanoate synthase subunit PhaC
MADPRPQTPRCATGAGTAVVEQLARAPALLDPERLASGAGSLLRHGVHYAGQLASISLAARRFNPKRLPALRRSRLHRPPHLPPRHAGLPRAVRRGDTTVAEAHLSGKTRSCCSFANVVTSSSLAPTNVLLGNPSALKRVFESGGASLVLGLRNYGHLTCGSTGGCPLKSSRAPCVSARTSRSLPACSSTGTLCAR